MDRLQFYSFRLYYSHHPVLKMIKLRDMKDIVMIGHGVEHGKSTGRKQRMRISFSNLPTIPNAAWSEAMGKVTSGDLTLLHSLATTFQAHFRDKMLWAQFWPCDLGIFRDNLKVEGCINGAQAQKICKSLHQTAQGMVFMAVREP